jgi:hypothetical protein
MADSKITALTSIGTSTDPANDPLVLVDVSDTSMAATGTTKKVTLNNLLACSPTATLATATITGDLTVASSILKVTGGNVGINTASPTNTSGYKTLEIVGTGVNTGGMIRMKSSDASVSSYDFVDNNGRGIFAVSNHNLRFGCNDIEQYRIQPLGIFTWYDGASGTRMTLNATGLGVGAGPSYRLHVQGTASLQLVLQSNDTNANAKEGTVNVRHYTNAEEPVSAVGGFTTSTANEVYLGGGFSAGNAATLLGFYTAANNTTTIGTERVRVKGTGQVRFVPLAADPSGAEAGDVYYNSVSNRLKYYNGTAWTLI